jgi:hypothetical protein
MLIGWLDFDWLPFSTSHSISRTVLFYYGIVVLGGGYILAFSKVLTMYLS